MTNREKSRLLVLYGSQTFTAQEIAERIWRKTKVLGFKGPVQAMDDYPISRLIHEEFALFVCATTGQGDEPDNMRRFWKFLLRKNLPNNSLMKLKFGVVGLGDSSYSKFNFVGKKLHKRLLQLGATPLLNIALCDYQHDLGHDAVLMPWMDNFFGTMKSYFPDIRTDIMNNLFIPRWKVSLIKTDCVDNNLNGYSEDIYYGKGCKDHFLDATHLEVEMNDRTTDESHFQDVRRMVFKTIDSVPVEYTPGDIFNIRPRNSKEDIEDLFGIFEMHNIDIKPHHLLSVEEYHDDMPVPEFLKLPLTLYEVAEQYWDLKAYPTQYFFSLLALISEDKLEREKCMELSSPEGQEDWLNYCRRPRRTVLEIEKDMANYTQYKLGFSQSILMVKGAIPSKFYCQEEGRKRLSDTTLSQTASTKRVKIVKETEAVAKMPVTSTLEDENNMPETAVYITHVKIEKETQAAADMPGTDPLEDENVLPETAVYITRVKIEKETQAAADMLGTDPLQDEDVLPETAVYMTCVKIEKETQAEKDDMAGTGTLEDENNMPETAVTRVKIERETQAAADMLGTDPLQDEDVLPETAVYMPCVKIEKETQAEKDDMPATGTLEDENVMQTAVEITDNMSAIVMEDHTKLPVVSTVHVDVPSLVKKFNSMKAELEEMRDRLEVLHDFHKSTSKLTIEILFELLSTIKPRSFSIAGSCLKSEGRRIELLIVVVKYYSNLKKARLGLASNWLKNLNIGDRVFGWIKKGTMKFPQDTSIPLILIGPGTGLAPFRNLLQERCIRGTASNKTLHLFFGCRYKTKDFHCRDELEGMVESGELSLYCAFSRDQENKIYVQHKISEHRETLWSLLSRGGYIFISGNAKNMPGNVRDAFIEVVISKTGGVSLEEARKMLSDMERNNRLQVETW